jgi:hemerythrin superfamily protein
MNALTLLKQDHANVEELFMRFESTAPENTDELARIRDKVVEQLSKHAAIEEQLFYPAVCDKLGAERSFAVLEGLEEHHLVKITLSELVKMPPTHPRFRPKMTVLTESVRHHVEEEENEIFEQVREAFTVEELNELGDRMEELKAIAPSRPHPMIPDQPPLNILLGVPAAVIDLTVTTAKELVGSLVHARQNRKESAS